MLSFPSDFPLSLTTQPLFIAFAYLSDGMILLSGIIILNASRRSANLAGVMQSMEENSQWSWYRSIEDLWRKRLRAFRVVIQQDDASVHKEVMLTWDLMQSPSKLTAGLTMVALGAFSLLLLVLSQGAIFRNLPLLLALGIVFSLGGLLQRSIAYGIGFRRVREAVRRRVTYADLRERQLSDYRSDVFRWLLGLLIGANGLLLLLLPYLPGLPVPTPLAWERLAICIGMLATFIVGELCMSRIVTLPRLVVTPDLVVAQRADDLLRALTINRIHFDVMAFLGIFLCLQWFFFLPWLLSSPFLLGMQVVVTILCLLCWAPTAMRSRDEGRLGGRRTGWPWKAAVVW